MFHSKIGYKGTTKIAHTQVRVRFLQKNVYFCAQKFGETGKMYYLRSLP